MDDYLLFLAVADGGGLAGAKRATGVSVPTLSRRMTEMETQLGQRLFARGPRGYTLTIEGRALLNEAEGLRDAAARLKAFTRSERKMRVRITAGHWTAQFLALNITRFWSEDEDWVPEFTASNAAVDIARREADIGVRNKRPDQNWQAGRRTATIDFAVFATSSDVRGYTTLPEASTNVPSVKWVRDNYSDDIITTANDARLALDLALSGIGRIVLPIFAANVYPSLVQIGDSIPALSHEEWLVTHHEARHDPPVRKALDAISNLLSDKSLRSDRG